MYSALLDGMPAQHVASVHKDGRHRTNSEPDGVPHDVVGLSALFSFLFAAVVLGMWLSGSTGRIAAVAICMIGVPMLVSGLRQRSARERAER
jgi:Flp pilus assembly protein TadB